MVNRCERVGSVGYMNAFPDFNIPEFEMRSYNERFHEANVIIDASSAHIYYPEHWGGLSLKCAFNGSENYRTTKTHYRVDDSSFLVFNEGNLYSSWIDESKPVESFTLNMTPGFERQATSVLFCPPSTILDDPFRVCAERIHFVECLYRHDGEITMLMMQMRSLAKDLYFNSLRLEEMFFDLFVAMNSLQTKTHLSNNENYLKRPAQLELYQRLLHARDFMHSCFSDDLTLSDISDVACLNKFHFLREFKKAFGKTPHQFLTHVRIMAARERMSRTSDPIEKVGNDVGYSDLSSFSKLFKKATGYAPATYRAMYQ